LTRQTDRNGRVTEYTYDMLGRLTSEQWKTGGSTVRTLSFAYDAASRLTSASDPAASYAYAYDNLDRIKSVTHDLAGLSFDVDVTSAYNAASDRTQVKATVGGAADFVNDYLYDNLHRLTQIKQHGVTGGNTVAEKRVDFAYDALSRFSTISRYEDLAGTKNVANSTFTYDATGRVTNLSHAKGATTLAGYAWAYDRANRVTSFTNALYSAESATYTHDTTDQLTGADRFGTSSDESYTYDDNGNRTNAGYSTGANNRLLSDGTYNYEYDNEGNRTKETNIATGAVREFTWDHRNRLVKITERPSAVGAATKIVEYNYDVFDLRVEKNVDTNADGVFDQGTRWITDGADVVLAFDKNGAVTNRYLHGPAIDQILADENALGEVLWPLTDNQGTARDLADYNAGTNTTTVANHITYTAFGAIQSQSNVSISTAYAYTGQEWDADAKQYYYNARWYDANSGRFLSEDPIYDDYNNPHRYVGNSPTNATDPSGREEIIDGDTPSRLTTYDFRKGRIRGFDVDKYNHKFNLYRSLRGVNVPVGQALRDEYFTRSCGGMLIAPQVVTRLVHELRLDDDGSVAAATELLRRNWLLEYAVDIANVPADGRWHKVAVLPNHNAVDLMGPVHFAGKDPRVDWWTTFLLGRSDNLFVSGAYEIRIDQAISVPGLPGSTSYNVTVRNVSLLWELRDRVDAHSAMEYEWSVNSVLQGFSECIVGDLIGDKLLGSAFEVVISLQDQQVSSFSFGWVLP
jgi:RHS repeat-associated protein